MDNEVEELEQEEDEEVVIIECEREEESEKYFPETDKGDPDREYETSLEDSQKKV